MGLLTWSSRSRSVYSFAASKVLHARAYVTRRARGGHLMDGFQILMLFFVGILAGVVYEMSKGVQGD